MRGRENLSACLPACLTLTREDVLWLARGRVAVLVQVNELVSDRRVHRWHVRSVRPEGVVHGGKHDALLRTGHLSRTHGTPEMDVH